MGRWLFLLWLAAPAAADTLVAARTIPSQSVIAGTDLALVAGTVPGALSDPSKAIGLETRVALYAGRPIRAGDLAPPALIERNALVTLSYRRGGLVIEAEGRALGRAALGELVQVMNLGSRSTLMGVVSGPGRVVVGK